MPERPQFELVFLLPSDGEGQDAHGNESDEVADQVPSQASRLEPRPIVEGIEEFTGDQELIIDFLDEAIQIDRLFGAADEVNVEIFIEVADLFHVGERDADIEVVFVARMMRQLELYFITDQLGTIHHGVHHHDLVELHRIHRGPGLRLLFGKDILIADLLVGDLVVTILPTVAFIDVVRDDEVGADIFVMPFLQFCEDVFQSFSVEAIVAVQDLEPG